jgi:methylenetetrahydrofolate dehydrogenase (NADP+)/methenyltetrahydrofolate cyclohydrolase
LAVISVGDNPASLLYVQRKKEAAQRIGVKVKKYLLPKEVSEEEILRVIDSFNQDKKIDGILIQMPLPKGIPPDRIIRAISLEKDVDGFTLKSKFTSPFILAIWQALKATKENLNNKRVVALVNSDIFGKTLVNFLRKQGLESYYFTDSETGKIQVKKADILITALGQLDFIKGSMIKEGAILIDGGISKIDGKIKGDIDRESVKGKAKWLAPVPGGLGPMTVAFLLKNVVLSTK